MRFEKFISEIRTYTYRVYGNVKEGMDDIGKMKSDSFITSSMPNAVNSFFEKFVKPLRYTHKELASLIPDRAVVKQGKHSNAFVITNCDLVDDVSVDMISIHD